MQHQYQASPSGIFSAQECMRQGRQGFCCGTSAWVEMVVGCQSSEDADDIPIYGGDDLAKGNTGDCRCRIRSYFRKEKPLGGSFGEGRGLGYFFCEGVEVRARV